MNSGRLVMVLSLESSVGCDSLGRVSGVLVCFPLLDCVSSLLVLHMSF